MPTIWNKSVYSPTLKLIHTPLNLILLGQSDVNKTIQLHSMQALWQRTAFRFHMTGLNKSEANSYITHHLVIAGKTEPLFTDDVIDEIFQQAKRYSTGHQ